MPNLKKIGTDQRGIASIIIVTILVVLLSLVSIGFSRLINRDITRSIESQKSRIASYAAESGVNQVIDYLKRADPLAGKNLASCQNDLLKKLNSTTGLSGDKNTEYTCVLLNLNPANLVYQKLDPLSSKVVKLQAPSPLGSVFISWKSSSDNTNLGPPGQLSLLDENSWNGKGYMPALRVTLYNVPSSGALSGPSNINRTFFLYPTKGGGTNQVDLTGPQAAADGSLISINCSNQHFNGFSYQSPGPGNCLVVFSSLPGSNDSGSTVYVRVTPVYGSADVRIEAQPRGGSDSRRNLEFINVQAIVDVTAKSNDVVKRLEARVDLGGASSLTETDNIPEFALRSAATICKRYLVPSIGDPTISVSDPADCGNPPPPQHSNLPVAITKPATDIQSVSVTLNGTVRPNDIAATYYFQYAPGEQPQPNESLTDVPAKPGDSLTIDKGAGFDYPVSKKILLDLSNQKPYHFRACGVNHTGTACGRFLPFVYNSQGGGGGCSKICLTVKNYSCSQELMPASITAYGPGVPAPGKTVWTGFKTTLHCVEPIPYFYDKVDMSSLGFTSNKGLVLVVHSFKYGPPYSPRSGDIYSISISMPGQPTTSPAFHYDNPSVCDTKWGPCPTPYPVRVNRNGPGTATSKPT